MFGFSLAELIVVCIVILIFIKPQDLPEIAHFIGRMIYRGKKFYRELKKNFTELEKEFGIDDLRQEVNRGIAQEANKIEQETTVIVDMYGNEHHITNIEEIRPDLTKEQIKNEINNSEIVKKTNQD